MPTLDELQALARPCDGANKNFQCDGFAKAFQTKLTCEKIANQGQVMVLRRTPARLDAKNQAKKLNHAMGSLGTAYPPGAKNASDAKNGYFIGAHERMLPKIILKEEGHALDGQVIGNESHFWTEVQADDGQTYCFDNLHPQGVLSNEYYASLDFSIERYLGTDNSRDDSKETFYNDEAHAFKSREDLLCDGCVVLSPMSVVELRELALDHADWTIQPQKILHQARTLTEVGLSHRQQIQVQQDFRGQFRQMREHEAAAKPVLQMAQDIDHVRPKV